MPNLRTSAIVAAALAIGLLGGCSSGSSDSSPATTETTAAANETTTTEVAAEPLQILVSNDDGYGAGGIDALVEGLLTLDDVEVTVVAPLSQQSGQGGKETEGAVEVTDVELPGGHPAKAVDGFPADSIRVAIDELGIEPDVVITGINEGQNLGPLVDLSGTVGAARAAVERGYPALASSQGLGEDLDYSTAVDLILDWVTERRDEIAAGDLAVEVTNLNIPTCAVGEVRDLVEIDADLDGDPSVALRPANCESEAASSEFDGDVGAFLAGFATIGVIPSEPAAG